MLLFIKYCGGCNPQYDRVKLVEETALLLNAQVVYSPKGADRCLLVSGCSRGCAHILTCLKTVPVYGPVDPVRLAAEISEETEKSNETIS